MTTTDSKTVMPQTDKSRTGRTRDRAAWAIANFALRYIATSWYRGMISRSIRLGLQTAAKQSEES